MITSDCRCLILTFCTDALEALSEGMSRPIWDITGGIFTLKKKLFQSKDEHVVFVSRQTLKMKVRVSEAHQCQIGPLFVKQLTDDSKS